jgi:hypothetical protein
MIDSKWSRLFSGPASCKESQEKEPVQPVKAAQLAKIDEQAAEIMIRDPGKPCCLMKAASKTQKAQEACNHN